MVPDSMSVFPKNPFPGLRPFQAEESHLFFGREKYIDSIISKLDRFHFVSIVGNSGSGKSSLLRAGVIPRISEQTDWIVKTMRPGRNPVDELNAILIGEHLQLTSEKNEEALRILNNSSLGLVQLLRNRMTPGKKLLLVVDQFEELFRFNRDKEERANHFVNLLLASISQHDVNISVIITLRSDFIGECEQFQGLPEAINNGQFLIPRMKSDELQLSITGPIEWAGRRISPRLVQQLLKDVGTNPDQLPILQHVLMRTWEVWQSMNDPLTPIDLIHYEQTGKMEKALSQHAEEAMQEVKAEDHETLAAIFRTITVKETDNRGVRRPTSIDKIARIVKSEPEHVIALINIFRRADRGFLMPPANIPLTIHSVIDISHESLMRVWDRLEKWVDEEHESAQIYQRLTSSALLYQKGLSGLWRDPDLQIATDWKESTNPNADWASQYNSGFEITMQFLEASAQNKLFMLADKNRRRRITNAVVMLVLICLSGLTIWAVRERNNSVRNEVIALQEKQRSQDQEKIARQQKEIALVSAERAEKERKNAELQKRLAQRKEHEANGEKQRAEVASANAMEARNIAESEKRSAILEKQRADSLRTVATYSEKNAYRLRILSTAQAMAIKSASIGKGSDEKSLKTLLAIQAHTFNKRYQGPDFSTDIYTALYLACKDNLDEDLYHNTVHTDMVRSVSYSPDDREIASCGSDGIMTICRSDKLQQTLRTFPKQNAILEHLCYNPTGDRIACSGDNMEVYIYQSAKNGSAPVVFGPLHNDKITGLGWLDQRLVTVSLDGTLKISDAVKGTSLYTEQFQGRPTCMRIEHSGQTICVGFEDGMIRLVSPNKKSVQDIRKMPGNISSIFPTHNGKLIVAGLTDGRICLVDLTDPKFPVRMLNRHKSTVTGISCSGNKLVSASFDGSVMLWKIDVDDPEPVILREHESWVWDIAFNHQGNAFVSAGKDKSMFTYAAGEEELVRLLSPFITRNFTETEWQHYAGKDIRYESSVTK